MVFHGVFQHLARLHQLRKLTSSEVHHNFPGFAPSFATAVSWPEAAFPCDISTTSTALICSLTPSSSCSLNGIRCEKRSKSTKTPVFFCCQSFSSFALPNKQHQTTISVLWFHILATSLAWQVIGSLVAFQDGGKGGGLYHVTMLIVIL